MRISLSLLPRGVGYPNPEETLNAKTQRDNPDRFARHNFFSSIYATHLDYHLCDNNNFLRQPQFSQPNQPPTNLFREIKTMECHYCILGVKPSNDEASIRSAYKKVCRAASLLVHLG
jgi:hypothetical protein